MKKTMRKILFAAFLLFCSPLLCIGLSAHTFRDVTQFEDAIELLSQIEVIKGYNAYAFGPDDNVTRWQMALLISKLRTGNTETAVWAASDDEIVFTDIVNERHYPASIAYAHSNGIIIGQAEGIFNPDANITVQDGLTMCVRALGLRFRLSEQLHLQGKGAGASGRAVQPFLYRPAHPRPDGADAL